VGGVGGYLLLTARGRALCADVEPRIEDLAGEVQRLVAAFDRTRGAVEEGWKTFNQLVSDESAPAAPWKASRR
jgi:hypothetical protein